jgi:hypothetical protein
MNTAPGTPETAPPLRPHYFGWVAWAGFGAFLLYGGLKGGHTLNVVAGSILLGMGIVMLIVNASVRLRPWRGWVAGVLTGLVCLAMAVETAIDVWRGFNK